MREMKRIVLLVITFVCFAFAYRDGGEEYRFTKSSDSTNDFSFE